jgi:hypothetical protein
VPVLIKAQDLYCERVGCAAVAPELSTVVVPLVTAEIVHVPTPIFNKVITDPTGIAAVALVGILIALADAFDCVIKV